MLCLAVEKRLSWAVFLEASQVAALNEYLEKNSPNENKNAVRIL